MSSEENRNVTVINQMTKVASGMILNNWNRFTSEPKNMTNQNTDTETAHRRNFKRQNIHLKYAEELYLKENQKKLIAQGNVPKNVTTKVTSQSEELLSDIMHRLELLGNRGKQVVRHLQNSIDKELAKDITANETSSSNDTVVVMDSEKRQSDMLTQILQKVDKFVKNSVNKGSEKTNITDGHEQREFIKIKNEILFQRNKQLLHLDNDNETDTAAEVCMIVVVVVGRLYTYLLLL